MTGREAIDSLRDVARRIAPLRTALNRHLGRQVGSAILKANFTNLAQSYFRSVRPYLLRLDINIGSVDALMERLLELTSRSSGVSQYKSVLTALKAELSSLEIQLERQLSDEAGQAGTSLTIVEKRILATLRTLLPATAASYEQVLNDLAMDRLSYRGTATELREILRETLDRLAPNADVMKSPGFQLERDRDKPTMAQKARFVLKLRGLAGNAIDAPKKSIEVVESIVSSFVRSTYDRGSIDTHTAMGIRKAQVNQLKMYVDSVLCELLEIHSQA